MNILVIAPHADDEIIGVGGTIIRNIEQGNNVYVCVVTRGKEPIFSEKYMENLRRETIMCHKSIGIKETFFLEFPAVMLEKENRYEINGKISEVIQKVCPDEVYIPHIGDMQKDHQIVAECTMVGLRPKYEHKVKRIFAYETLSETGWNIPNIQNEFIANVYIDISDYLNKKIEALGFYKSQVGEFPDARSLEAVEALAKFRGATMNMKAAEAFSLVREIIE